MVLSNHLLHLRWNIYEVTEDELMLNSTRLMFVFIIAFTFAPGIVIAAGSGAQIFITGTLVRNVTCEVEHSGDVNFGDAVSIGKIDGNYNKKQLSLTVSCNGDPIGQVKIAIAGDTVDIDGYSALKVNSYDGLGITFTSNSSKWNVNEYNKVEPGDTIDLDVALSKRSDANLNAGTFSTSATIALLIE